MDRNSGYSGTPLAKKLGLKPGFSIFLKNNPSHYFDLFSDLPDELTHLENAQQKESADFIHLFCKTFEELEDNSRKLMTALKKNGLLWISWPKGSSKIATDLKRDIIRNHMLDIGLVDVKVAAIDADWSGLKFVYRVEDR